MKNFKKLPKAEDVEQFQYGNMDITLSELTDENRQYFFEIAKHLYEIEPCRICGELIGDASNAVYAGYSKDNKSRAAHKSCWNSNLPKEKWAFPEDSE